MSVQIVLSEEQETRLQEKIYDIATSTLNKLEKQYPEYMNKKMVCEYVHAHNNTVDLWIQDYNFPIIKIQGVVRFSKKLVDEWMLDRVYNKND